MKNFNQYITQPIKRCILLALATITITLFSCNKMLDVGQPKVQLTDANVFTSDASAAGTIGGIYQTMAQVPSVYSGAQGISICQALAADETVDYYQYPNEFYRNLYNASSQYNTYYWPGIYTIIAACNIAVKGITASGSLSPAVRQQLLGDAKFARAFTYFYAVNLYGDVPLSLTDDITTNNTLGRAPVANVYKQIIQDLTDAQNSLPDKNYLTLSGAVSITDRTLPNKQVASALLARVYLYLQDWQKAESLATSVIEATNAGAPIYILEPVLNNVFLKTSREAIWQLQTITSGYANADSQSLLVTYDPGVFPAFPLSTTLLNAFEPGDVRFTNWVGQYTSKTNGKTYNYANKFKQLVAKTPDVATEYVMPLRFAEQYLIRAEARAKQGNIGGAQADLNIIRKRAGLANATAASQADLLIAIYHERQVELFTEFGHRWFDLKRTGRLDAAENAVIPQKPNAWAPYKALMPIPLTDLNIDHNLTQNPGY